MMQGAIAASTEKPVSAVIAEICSNSPDRIAVIIGASTIGTIWVTQLQAGTLTTGFPITIQSGPLKLTETEFGTLVKGALFAHSPSGAATILVTEVFDSGYCND